MNNILYHPFRPIYSKNSKILILGSFPSVKSREDDFYYAHKQNRFWKLIARVYNNDIPQNIVKKKKLILENNLAIWDVVRSCEIVGSADSSIQNYEINDINKFVNSHNIHTIIFNGNKAYQIYIKKSNKIRGIKYIILPSTSPANAQYSFDKLYDIWSKALRRDK